MRVKVVLLLLLTTMVFMSAIGPASAASRWVHMVTASTEAYYLDRDTVRIYFRNDDLYVDCWIKAQTNNGYRLIRTYIYSKNFSYLITDVFEYDMQGDMINQKNLKDNGWKAPPPSSYAEKLMQSVVEWASRNKASDA